MASPAKVDRALLLDAAKEETDSLSYYVNATGALLNEMHQDKRLRKSKLYSDALELLAWICADKTKRSSRDAALVSSQFHFFGTIGKALALIERGKSPQLRKELVRLSEDKNSEIGNWFLFYLAGSFAGHGYEVEFIPEEKNGVKTPDFVARKAGKSLFVEANAKQPVREIDTPEKVRQVIRDLIEEKRQKFPDPRFWPGMIAGEISPAHQLLDEMGKQRRLQLREDLVKWGPLPESFEYPIYSDNDFLESPHNRGSILHHLAEEFSQVDLSKTQVVVCMVCIARQAYRHGTSTSFPKGHQLVVRRGFESLAPVEIAKHRYVI